MSLAPTTIPRSGRAIWGTVLATIGSTLGLLGFLLGIRREVTIENLTRAFPDLDQAAIDSIAKKSFRNLGIVFAEMLYLRFASRRAVLTGMHVYDTAPIERSITEGKGVILLSAHLANWEWMALAIGLTLSQALDVVVKNQAGKMSERFLQTMRTRLGNRTVNAGDVKGIFRVLRSGGVLAMLGDQAAPQSSIAVEFFGRDVPTYEGPARLALRTGAALYLAECSREPNGSYAMRFHPVGHSDLPGPDDDSVAKLTARHTAMLEGIIYNAPVLWLWQHRRWKNVQGTK